MKQAEKSVPARRRPHPRATRRERGAALLLFMILVVMAALTYLVSSLGPELTVARQDRQTQDALVQAREALIGYALKYRESQPDRMYGYLPLPDLGSSRNNNVGCTDEGCDANTFTGIAFDANGIGPSVVGRFPWRTLGTEPLRDGNGECLWLIVSSLHSRIHASSWPYLPAMNGDTLGQFDVVVANGGAALASALAGPHERPVAVIFSPGPPLPGQDRSPSATDNVKVCGGNYDAKNYLDPVSASALGGVTNYLAGTNAASGSTGDSDPSNDPDTPKGLSTGGKVFASGSTFHASGCQGTDCILLANDNSLALTPDTLFSAIRKSSYFRTDINSMLDRMTNCLRDKFVAGGFAPAAIGGYTPPADKSAGRIPSDACYDSTQAPLGYFDHYQDMIFVAKPNSGSFTVNGDASCAGVLLFANQRGTGQTRASTTTRNALTNYLEGDNSPSYDANLNAITNVGTTFSGASLFGRVTASRTNPQDVARCLQGATWRSDLPDCQTVDQDIARCVPAGTSFTTVTSPALGANQLVAYDAGTRTLTLGRENVVTWYGNDADALFGCAWFSESRNLGSGIRSYFRFQFKEVGSNVGFNGFVFAIADAIKNAPNNFTRCGAGASHLGYSGNNGVTGMIEFPKIGIEFDQGRNAGFSEVADLTTGQPGRNDPCLVSSCGAVPAYPASSHAAIVYWGHEVADTITDLVNRPHDDDNVHGYPTAGSLAGVPRPPRSHSDPVTESGIKYVNLRDNPNDSSLYHVRVELTPTRASNADASLSNTVMRTEVWIADNATTSASRIAALKNTTRPMSQQDATFGSTLGDTATLYDVKVEPSSCTYSVVPDGCPVGQACGSNNMCYRPALERIQLGFTGSQRTSDQEVEIQDFFTTWLE